MLQKIRPIHPFPARMAPELVWEELVARSEPLQVLDPMMGSGTTIVASRLCGHQATGIDRDPLAVLIARTWASNTDPKNLQKKASEVLARARKRMISFTAKTAFPREADDETKEFLKFWFDLDNRKQLTALAASIDAIRDSAVRDVLWCAFSRLIITKASGVSLAMDISHSRPHRVYSKAPRRAFEYFEKAVGYITKASPFNTAEFQKRPEASVLDADARKMPISDGSIDLIITSPPYLNAIDYLRGHKLSLVWMGHSIAEVRMLRATNVGSEVSAAKVENGVDDEVVMDRMCVGNPLNEKLSGMLTRYVGDLRVLLKECYRVLTKTGEGVFVIGDCTLRGTFIANSVAIELIAGDVGFEVANIRSRPLPENRRYLPPPEVKSSGKALCKRMREEVILTLRK